MMNTSITLRTQVSLNEDDLSDQAKKQFMCHHEILRAYQLNASVILTNHRLSSVGRHLYCLTLGKNYSDCKKVLNYVANHPELKIPTQSIRSPLILCGLPRTGTTLLLNLLACDPACRAPLLMDMKSPVPPLSRSDLSEQIERNKFASVINDMLNALGLTDYLRETRASHPAFANEEDLFILSQGGLNWPGYLLASDRENAFTRWFLNDTNKDFVYEYHKIFFQMLNSVDTPSSHWIFKTAIHALYFDTLLKYYPDASLIMTHRRLDEVLPSCARLAIAYINVYFDSNKTDVATDMKMAVELLLDVIDVAIRRIVQFRRINRDAAVLDIFYDDLLAQPIATVRRIYERFHLSWSEEFEQAMRLWLHENPQGKQGRNVYTLEEFEMDREAIDRKYEEYNQMFLKSPPQLKEDADGINNPQFTPTNTLVDSTHN